MSRAQHFRHARNLARSPKYRVNLALVGVPRRPFGFPKLALGALLAGHARRQTIAFDRA